ncbi:DMT family transporter [Vallitalea pronyensis]|uniref:DMT family transporter n=1 Tax=Vallitalea pronyensis TaxID=1348613 RepID=A0A8J8MLU9_9FIRM|nr:DMT family transporter [Vallitalea pronyensis]QUI23896.1 DMT family transporter [Vallitalea pronyensis]
MGVIASIISGALMSIQGVFNTRVTESSSIWVTNSFVQITGFAVCLIAWFFSGRDSFNDLFKASSKWYLTGGILGAFIIFTVVKGMATLGPCYAVMLILIAQLLVAYTIELLGIFGTEQIGFEWKKAIGVGIMVVGIVIFQWD